MSFWIRPRLADTHHKSSAASSFYSATEGFFPLLKISVFKNSGFLTERVICMKKAEKPTAV